FVESHRTTSRSSGGQNIDAVRDTNSPNRKKPSPLHDPPTTDHRDARGWRALRGRVFHLKHQTNATANACKQVTVVSFSALTPSSKFVIVTDYRHDGHALPLRARLHSARPQVLRATFRTWGRLNDELFPRPYARTFSRRSH